MSISVASNPANPNVRIFSLDGFPSVLHPANGVVRMAQNHEANAHGSPAAAAIFLRFYGRIAAINMTAIGGTNGQRKTDLIQVTLAEGQTWEHDVRSADVTDILQHRLASNLGIVITPDVRDAFHISLQDLRQAVQQLRPETVNSHNRERADTAITVPDNGWNQQAKTLTLQLGEACGTKDESVCGDINQAVTKQTLSGHLQRRYPGLRVQFV